jgi:hypothetical protein
MPEIPGSASRGDGGALTPPQELGCPHALGSRAPHGSPSSPSPAPGHAPDYSRRFTAAFASRSKRIESGQRRASPRRSRSCASWTDERRENRRWSCHLGHSSPPCRTGVLAHFCNLRAQSRPCSYQAKRTFSLALCSTRRARRLSRSARRSNAWTASKAWRSHSRSTGDEEESGDAAMS